MEPTTTDVEDGDIVIDVKIGLETIYVADVIGLSVDPVFQAPAFIVVLVETKIGFEYT